MLGYGTVQRDPMSAFYFHFLFLNFASNVKNTLHKRKML